MSNWKMNFSGLLFGAAFGGILAAGKLHEYDTIHLMLRLDEFYVYGFMGSAILVATSVLWFIENRKMATIAGEKISLQRSKPRMKHIKGGAIFGIGWALAGTCPAPALVMLSSGAMLALVVIPGIFLGIHLGSKGESHNFGDGEHHQKMQVMS